MSKARERWKTPGDVLGHDQYHSVVSVRCMYSYFGSSVVISMQQMLCLVPPLIPNHSWMLLRAVILPRTRTANSQSFL